MTRPRVIAAVAGLLAAAMTIAGFLLPETAATELLVGPMIAGILIGAAPFGGLHDNLPTAPVVLIAAIATLPFGALCAAAFGPL